MQIVQVRRPHLCRPPQPRIAQVELRILRGREHHVFRLSRREFHRLRESTFESTAGCRSATGPALAAKYTSRHSPIFLSGGEGFQSTNVIARLFSVGAHTCTATTFVPRLTAEVTLNS